MKYRIRELRKEKGLSQQELANKAGCTRQFINMLENSDEINISTKMLISIATALEVSVDTLLFSGESLPK